LEQVLAPAIGVVREWLGAAPRLQIIATSRAPLGLAGEQRLTLGPLATTGAGELSEAASLFVDRARLAHPELAGEASVIESIVAQLEGLPLAIELAASRAGTFALDEIYAELGRPFRLLREGPADAPERHRSLWRAMEWSWSRLRDDEREVLAQATVFRGGFDAPAAEAVIRCRPGAWVRDLLARLADQSLLRVVRADDGAPRFDMYAAIREHAEEKLEPDDARSLAQRHAGHYLAAAAGRAWNDTLAEAANLRAAAEYAWRFGPPGPAELDVALRALVALGPTMMRQGSARELDAGLTRALEAHGHASDLRAQALGMRAEARRDYGDTNGSRDDLHEAQELPASTATRARLQLTAGSLHFLTADLPAARRAYEQACADSDASSRDVEAIAFGNLARVRHMEGDLTAALTDYQRGLERFAELGDHVGRGRLLGSLGFLHQDLGDLDAAAAAYEEALALAHEHGDLGRQGTSLTYLGNVARHRGQLAEAERIYAEGLAMLARAGHRHFEGVAAMDLGIMRVASQGLESAEAAFARAAEICAEVEDPQCGALVRGYLGALAARRGDLASAEALLDAAERPARHRRNRLRAPRRPPPRLRRPLPLPRHRRRALADPGQAAAARRRGAARGAHRARAAGPAARGPRAGAHRSAAHRAPRGRRRRMVSRAEARGRGSVAPPPLAAPPVGAVPRACHGAGPPVRRRRARPRDLGRGRHHREAARQSPARRGRRSAPRRSHVPHHGRRRLPHHAGGGDPDRRARCRARACPRAA
jgi:predicted ATPase